MNEFWMIYVEDGGKPNQAYLTYDAAEARAKHLAAVTGHRVFVLKSVKVVTASVPVTAAEYAVEDIK